MAVLKRVLLLNLIMLVFFTVAAGAQEIFPDRGGVITGSTNSEDYKSGREFSQRYNLVFNTGISDGIWAQTEVSGDFTDLMRAQNRDFPDLSRPVSTPLEVERVELFVDKDEWNARFGNRLRTTLDTYTLYDQELLGAEAQVRAGGLGATVIMGQNQDQRIAAINGQYQLTPDFQVGGTVVSTGREDEESRVNYGLNSYMQVFPGVELGGQYYRNEEEEGGSALDLTAWTALAGLNLEANFSKVDQNYWAPLAERSEDTYIPGRTGYDLSADTMLGTLGLSAHYGVHDQEDTAERRVSKGVGARVPLIPNRLDVEAQYNLVDVDALYSADYSEKFLNLDSTLKLTDQVTLKAGYELNDGSQSDISSISADIGMDLTDKASLTAEVTYGKEDGYRKSTSKEAGLEFGYSINEFTQFTANYHLINFDSSLENEDFRSNQALAEVKLKF